MTGDRRVRAVLLGVLALALVAGGMLLRPLVIPENESSPPVLTPTEVGFVQDMTAHHQQALIMVQRLDSGVDPGVRALAQQIADTQRMEIGTLLGWLRLADASPMSGHPMAWMHSADSAATQDHSGMSMPTTTAAAGSSMPGMATLAELDALAAARGPDAETLFLQLMLRHHQGGVDMAQALLKLVHSGAVMEAARGMVTTQTQEAGLMTLLLAQRNAQPLS
ncbi:DUF305 domain-containing protein [Nocardia jejuensis]|uniref:DUF305 domain-containing protein n=1 Tax=Nocardia jejuensis TaxID=328049 RepID=UPI000835199D|nr:DUF305 domain-containing protein [Nocardia jejuensis]